MIPVNKIENRIMFQIKTGFYLELLMLETMTFLESTKSKMTKDENSENVPHLEVLIHCDIDNNDYQQDPRILPTFVLSKSIGQLIDISPNTF